MSTRARVAVRRQDGQYLTTLVTYDGHEGHSATILAKHYKSPVKIVKLLSVGGHLKALEPDVADVEAMHDPGEAKVVEDPTADTYTDFLYTWEAGVWYSQERRWGVANGPAYYSPRKALTQDVVAEIEADYAAHLAKLRETHPYLFA